MAIIFLNFFRDTRDDIGREQQGAVEMVDE
jgi:hypothetical protein